MCGIVGFIDLKKQMGLDRCRQVVRTMSETLVHRGPDASGVWVDPEHRIALAHRRLSVIELSDAARQPMQSVSGRYILVYNGEIYNFPALKRDLTQSGIVFAGNSDTEVALAAIEYWGLEQALDRFVGMFAFALWDRQHAVLSLVRDRLGEKPLYFGLQGDVILFGSELKAFRAYPKWRGEIDRNALALYMRHNAVPAPWTIFQGIRKVKPAHLVQIGKRQQANGAMVFTTTVGNNPWVASERSYWSLDEICSARKEMVEGDEHRHVEKLSELLEQSIRGQMLSDVPLGAFLSGGIDSSTVVAVMQSVSMKPVKTFSIGFSEVEYNEAPHARAIADHLGTDHTELLVTPADALAAIPQMASVYDEPFADSSQIPTWLVAKLAREQVTVALSGDGGDELFAGYDRYHWAQNISRSTNRLPGRLRKRLASWLQIPSVSTWDRLAKPFRPVLHGIGLDQYPGHKIHRLASMLGSQDRVDLYRTLISHWGDLDTLVIGSREYSSIFTDQPESLGQLQEIEQYMLLDMLGYLPDDILTKVDRASMAHSLEVRVPLLDHRLVEHAWHIPLEIKQRGRQTKWPLREILRRYVPDSLTDRPKMGFGVPIDHWLRGPLRDWAEALLDEDQLKSQGFFNPAPIRARWQEHLSGSRNWQHHLWDVLMFQDWYAKQSHEKSCLND